MQTEQDTEREERPPTQALSTAFVGREEILDAIKRHLLKGQHVCLYGDRGIGKTAIRTTAGKLLLEKEQLQALKEPVVGLVKFGGSGWRRVRVQPYFARVGSGAA